MVTSIRLHLISPVSCAKCVTKCWFSLLKYIRLLILCTKRLSISSSSSTPLFSFLAPAFAAAQPGCAPVSVRARWEGPSFPSLPTSLPVDRGDRNKTDRQTDRHRYSVGSQLQFTRTHGRVTLRNRHCSLSLIPVSSWGMDASPGTLSWLSGTGIMVTSRWSGARVAELLPGFFAQSGAKLGVPSLLSESCGGGLALSARFIGV